MPVEFYLQKQTVGQFGPHAGGTVPSSRQRCAAQCASPANVLPSLSVGLRPQLLAKGLLIGERWVAIGSVSPGLSPSVH